jgi:hypothetical protein
MRLMQPMRLMRPMHLMHQMRWALRMQLMRWIWPGWLAS